MLLKNIHSLSGRIVLRSGLHIGAGKDSVEIGGLDQPIIKDPVSGNPYIPGSSIKGKMRSLLETSVFMARSADTRRCVMEGKPCSCGRKDCPACTLFGAHTSADKCEDGLGPTRLLVRDAVLTDAFRELSRQGQLPMEIKYENIINRVSGVAEHPRPLERVPAGTEFDFQMALRVYEGDDAELVQWVYKGLKLVELDALGGCGSRGSGQVRFVDLLMDGQPVNLDGITAF